MKKKAAIFLWAVRCVALAMILCAFFQPTLRLKTLATDQGSVAVFIDASKSMRLFGADSLLGRLPALRDLLSAKPPGKADVRFFCFGDSLRPCDPASLRDSSFIDKHSFFPTEPGTWRTIIILSDGNWSNPSLATDFFENRNCYFLSLPALSPRPFLRCDCISFQTPVLKDSLSKATLNIQGYKRTGSPLTIDVKRGLKPLFHRQRTMNAGYFNDTISLTFPTAQAGRFLYSIGVRERADTLSCQLNFVGNVVPAVFTALIVSSAPSLDARFVSLALSGDRSWRIDNSPGAARTADALFILDWDKNAQRDFPMLKPSGVAAFIGCLPCASRVVTTNDTLALFSPQPGDTQAQRILQRKLPSPAQVVACGQSPFPIQRPLLECIVREKKPPHSSRGPSGADTLPFLLTGVFHGRSAVALASRNIWHMEFLPLSLDQENESGSLLGDVLSIVKESLISGLNRTFFVYPISEANEYDSCAFCIVLPQELAAIASSSNELPVGHIRFTLKQENLRVLDTAFIPELGAISGTHTFRCRPLPAGTYAYSAVLSFEKKQFSWADTVAVHKNDLELSIQGQNTVLLNQIAIPLDGSDPNALSAALSRNPGLERNATTAKIFQMKRSWLLFGIIIGLLSFEWIMRRKWGLDG